MDINQLIIALDKVKREHGNIEVKLYRDVLHDQSVTQMTVVHESHVDPESILPTPKYVALMP